MILSSSSRSSIPYSGCRRIFCPSSLNRITVMALCIRADSSLSFSVKLDASSPVSLTAKQETSQSLYTSLAKTDRGRREMP